MTARSTIVFYKHLIGIAIIMVHLQTRASIFKVPKNKTKGTEPEEMYQVDPQRNQKRSTQQELH